MEYSSFCYIPLSSLCKINKGLRNERFFPSFFSTANIIEEGEHKQTVQIFHMFALFEDDLTIIHGNAGFAAFGSSTSGYGYSPPSATLSRDDNQLKMCLLCTCESSVKTIETTETIFLICCGCYSFSIKELSLLSLKPPQEGMLYFVFARAKREANVSSASERQRKPLSCLNRP